MCVCVKTGGDNGRNPDVAQDQPFAWEYVHMDDLLVDLKLPPETLEIPIPSYFVEQREEQHNRRDRLIEGCVVVVVAVVFMAICFCVFVLVSFGASREQKERRAAKADEADGDL